MLLNLSDLSSEPLQQQMVRQLRAQILAGHLIAGQPLPSIRCLARDQRVSVTTVQRAYDELDREGLVHSRRGKGFFVAGLAPAQRLAMAVTRAREALQPALCAALADGLSKQQIRRLIETILDDEGEPEG